LAMTSFSYKLSECLVSMVLGFTFANEVLDVVNKMYVAGFYNAR